ncbi:hypothetical protein CONPUDRAFT_154965 [Coniophora puteana RWD-64-598 SS2]|uniref:Uncharacterized protein n=1 Tax=Coniophora puteana (strain RWD-64-598) TaxID=741705 RepID=A0A5M3MKM0_CONPW|nr:uncharacterized protein CONPUDRAFT_154965 [Coniophora puteana RWD-64-598 SS2]EIW79567.1 hypothetical protein CONPUDRAFT_154965 [Coniophora puteana RWD-64-598 SS2]
MKGAMRELNVPDLPLPHEISKLRVVETCIRNTLNAVRCSLKGQVEKSLEPGATTQNVAELTMAALGTSRIKATLQHYMRFAFLRWVSTSYPDASEQYWIKVDEKLLFARSKYQSATDLSAFFTAIYNNDVQKHGNPTSTHHTVVAPNKISEFQSVLNRHAGLVVPPPPEEESSKKRKRNKA